jgi:hypothetical protein
MTLIERFESLRPLLGEKGMQDLANAVAEYRAVFGKKWLAEFKTDNPTLSELIDLIANYEFDEAWLKLNEHVETWIDAEDSLGKRVGLRIAANAFLPGAKPDIAKLHAFVRFEIDRPRD